MNKYNIGDVVDFTYHGAMFKQYRVKSILDWNNGIMYRLEKNELTFDAHIKEIDIFKRHEEVELNNETSNEKQKEVLASPKRKEGERGKSKEV